MSVTNRKRSILRKNPYGYAKRRSFVARAMGLSPIGDIANPTLSENTDTGALTWETASDWDSAVDSAGIVHESNSERDLSDATVLQLGTPTGYKSSSVEALWPSDEDSGSTIFDVSGNNRDLSASGATPGDANGLYSTTSWSYDGTDDYADINALQYDETQSFTVNYWFYRTEALDKNDRILGFDTSGSSGGGWGFLFDGGFVDGGSDLVFRAGGTAAATGAASNTNTWYMVTLVNYGDGTQDVYVDASVQVSPSLTWSTPSGNFTVGTTGRSGGPYTDNSETFGGQIEDVGVWTSAFTSGEVSALDIRSGSYLTTATKSFASSAKPDLASLDYALNSQTVTLDVIGSPGTASEEIVNQTLDGATSYSLTWSNSHTDFRVKVNMSTADPTVTPTLNSMSLQ